MEECPGSGLGIEVARCEVQVPEYTRIWEGLASHSDVLGLVRSTTFFCFPFNKCLLSPCSVSDIVPVTVDMKSECRLPLRN